MDSIVIFKLYDRSMHFTIKTSNTKSFLLKLSIVYIRKTERTHGCIIILTTLYKLINSFYQCKISFLQQRFKIIRPN